MQQRARELERDMTGVLRFVVYLEGPPDSMRRPEVLASIEKIERAIKASPLVTYSVSLADVVAQANQAFAGGDQAERRVPRSRALIAQYLALLDPQDRSSVVSDDYTRSQIAILVRDEGSAAALALGKKLEDATAASGLRELGVRVALTGNGIVTYRELQKVVVELVLGFAIAFGIVVALQWLMFRSLRIALISVVPNLVPIVFCLLTLRLLSMALRIDSSLVFGIAIGGLFNTTIHLAARIRQMMAQPSAMIPSQVGRRAEPPRDRTGGPVHLGHPLGGVRGVDAVQLPRPACARPSVDGHAPERGRLRHPHQPHSFPVAVRVEGDACGGGRAAGRAGASSMLEGRTRHASAQEGRPSSGHPFASLHAR